MRDKASGFAYRFLEVFSAKGMDYFGGWQNPFLEESLFDFLGERVDGMGGGKWWGSRGCVHR